MKLKDTAKLMTSDDYRDRFKAEYYQLKERLDRLNAFNVRIEASDMTRYCDGAPVAMPEHDCPVQMLVEQQNVMTRYLHILEVRAVIEGIEL